MCPLPSYGNGKAPKAINSNGKGVNLCPERRQMRIDREKLHSFVEQRCDQIESYGDEFRGKPLTALHEAKLKAAGGDILALSLAENIAYGIGVYLVFHALEFVTLPTQLRLDQVPTQRRAHEVELVWEGKGW